MSIVITKNSTTAQLSQTIHITLMHEKHIVRFNLIMTLRKLSRKLLVRATGVYVLDSFAPVFSFNYC